MTETQRTYKRMEEIALAIDKCNIEIAELQAQFLKVKCNMEWDKEIYPVAYGEDIYRDLQDQIEALTEHIYELDNSMGECRGYLAEIRAIDGEDW